MAISTLRQVVTQDLAANRGYPKSVAILVTFRLAQYVRQQRGPMWRPTYLVVGGFYKLLSEWILGVELPASTRVGAGLQLRHGVGVVVNPACVIGEGVMIRQGVTLGNRRADSDCPVIEDNVQIGAGATLIGDIVVGARARIGAGAVVVTDVPADATVHAAPAVIRLREAPRNDAESI